MDKSIRNKIAENFVYIIDTAIERQIVKNPYVQHLSVQDVIYEVFQKELSIDGHKDLYTLIRKRISDYFYIYINHWKKYKAQLPLIFTKQRMTDKKCKPKLAAKFTSKPVQSPLKQHIMEIPQSVQQQQQEQKENNNIVLIKIDALKENFFTATYVNVTNSEKEYLSKQMISATELLNQRRRECTR